MEILVSLLVIVVIPYLIYVRSNKNHYEEQRPSRFKNGVGTTILDDNYRVMD